MTELPIPISEIFPDARRVKFDEIQKYDVVGVIDRLGTHNSLKINIAIEQDNINFWGRKQSNNCYIQTASANSLNVFLIHRPDPHDAPTTIEEEEAFLLSMIENHEKASSISGNDIQQGDLVISVDNQSAINVGYADEFDKFGWYTKSNNHLTPLNSKIYLFTR